MRRSSRISIAIDQFSVGWSKCTVGQVGSEVKVEKWSVRKTIQKLFFFCFLFFCILEEVSNCVSFVTC